MKTLLTLALLACAAVLMGCTGSKAKEHKEHIPALENGAKFKEGQGLSFTETMATSIGLKTAAVEEENIHPVLTIELQSTSDGKEISGWLNTDQANRIKPGMAVDLSLSGESKTIPGTVRRIEKSDYVAGGDYEIVVASSQDFKAGTAVQARFQVEATDTVTAIPKSALLSTAEGPFVYAKNGEFYVRTAIKVGASGSDTVEVLDGLYAGDEIVTRPVMSLWLAELQILRGGKACTCGL